MEKINLIPLDGKIVVRPEDEQEKLKSGIILPPNREQKRKQVGYVLILDDENRHNLKVGDKIVFEAYGVHEVNHDGKELLIIDTNNTEVLAVINTDTTLEVHGEAEGF